MLVAGFLIGKYVYYDTTWNSLTEELNTHMALNNIGLCKIEDLVSPSSVVAFNFSTLKTSTEGQ
jgi:hypothetical protein